MQITHQEAHRLIQLELDQALDAGGTLALSAHLEDCPLCRVYADEIMELEGLLSPVMNRHWDVRPIPLSIRSLVEKSNSVIPARLLLTIRKIAIVVIFAGFVLSTWQFMASIPPTATAAADIPLVLSPSAQPTSTRGTPQDCSVLIYNVQRNDTLAKIAQHFSVSTEEIMAANQLKTETLNTTMKLRIRSCDFTPTSTLNASTLTTTFTPALSPVTATPGG